MDNIENNVNSTDTIDENYLVFICDEKKFALSFKNVEVIVTGKKPTEIPDFPDYVMGTIVVYENTVTVINLRRRFGYTDKDFSDRDCIIVTPGKIRLGLLCDKADGFAVIKKDKILPPPDIEDETAGRFITGEFVDSSGEIIYIISPKLVIKPEDEDKIFN